MTQMEYEVYNTLYQGPGDVNYPQQFAVDDSTLDPYGNAAVVGQAQIYPYPLPQQNIPAKLVYQSLPPDIASPSTSGVIPWFPNSLYLVTELASQLCMFTDDTRVDVLHKRAEDILGRELTMIEDDEGYAQTVKLDPNVFRPRSSSRATKALPL
jgi:hypothetical protein